MTALADHLRRQIDQNKNASYFNIDILKYQVIDLSIVSRTHSRSSYMNVSLQISFPKSAVCRRELLVEICFQIKSKPGFESVPLELASFWCSDDQRADFHLNYNYNNSSMSPPAALSNVSVILPVTAPVSNMQSTPDGTWLVFSIFSISFPSLFLLSSPCPTDGLLGK